MLWDSMGWYKEWESALHPGIGTLLRQNYFFFFFFFWPCQEAYGILILQLGVEPMPSALEAWSLNHLTARRSWDKCLSGTIRMIYIYIYLSVFGVVSVCVCVCALWKDVKLKTVITSREQIGNWREGSQEEFQSPITGVVVTIQIYPWPIALL